MHTVTVVFTTGNVVSFEAEEFDANLETRPGVLQKYSYKNARGEDSAIYLKPRDVAGLFLTQSPPNSQNLAVYYTTPQQAPARGTD